MNKLLQKFRERAKVPVGKVNGVVGMSMDVPDEFEEKMEEEVPVDNTVYEQAFVAAELERYSQTLDKPKVSAANILDELEDVEDIPEFQEQVPKDFYQHSKFEQLYNKRELPIDSVKQKILNILNINNIVVIKGPTGCGKTTQVAQFILDDCRSRNEPCKIVVTQPRKIAAINVARRVCEERGWTLGTLCGYQVGLEKRVCPEQLITYVTTGVLLQKLVGNKSLTCYTHILIDEVHERTQDLDFLLLIVRKFLNTNSQSTKVVLMSATIDAEDFAHYFRFGNSSQGCVPIIEIEKQSSFLTQFFYLEDLHHNQKTPLFELDTPEISAMVWNTLVFLTKAFDSIDMSGDPTDTKIGSVLVFLPGLYEIEVAHRKLMDEDRSTCPIQWDIIPLHSSLPNDEQYKAFKPAAPNVRKIILSTNIAESSVTVTDIVYVVDFCQTKVMTVDPISKFQSLRLEWASHVNCLQRSGRVGRVADGRVYRLVTKNFYEHVMPKRGDPEILRAPLEQVVLLTKMLHLNETPKQILALALNPPNVVNIDTTILNLKEAGGLLKTCRGLPSSVDGDLTFLGLVMASLPLDIHLSKLIVLGHIFSCLDDAISIAAGCSIPNIFAVPFKEKFDSYKKMLVWSDGASCDLIALLNLFNVWQLMNREGHFRDRASERQWYAINFVNRKGIREWNTLVTELKERLTRLKITEVHGQGKVKLSNAEKSLVLKVVTSGAFYPNYFIRSPQDAKDEREAVKTVAGHDPLRTVYFTGMDPTQPKQIYVRAIKDLICDNAATDATVGFDGGAKIYIEFKQNHNPDMVNMFGQPCVAVIPGKIPQQVYHSIRKRQLKYDFSLKVLPHSEAWEWANKCGLSANSTMLDSLEPTEQNCFTPIDYNPLPALDNEYIKCIITSRIDAGHFYVQNYDTQTQSLLEKIWKCLNRPVLHSFERTGRDPLKYDDVYVARFQNDSYFYRCKIISENVNNIRVRFIDYGNVQKMRVQDLFKLPSDLECKVKPLAVECMLQGIKPSINLNPKAIWKEEINRIFDEKTQKIVLYGRVYSVIDNIVRLELFRQLPGESRNEQLSLNEWLVQQGYAQEEEESFLSSEDHIRRLKVQSSENPNMAAGTMRFDKPLEYNDFKAPDIGTNFDVVTLKGPFSPLEMSVIGCTDSASHQRVDIEFASINTVLLDTEPQYKHSRLLVARHVAQSSMSNRLTLRQTTLLPNIPGIPALMALIFCPTMEPKLTEDGSRVANILCGLGANEISDKPIYPIHDLVLTLDTDLTSDEINKINEMRYRISNAIKTMQCMYEDQAGQDTFLGIQKCVKTILFQLIYMSRTSVEPVHVSYSNIWHKNSGHGTVIKSVISEDPRDIYPLLWFIQLYVSNKDKKLRVNIEQLYEMARELIPFEPIACELCSEGFLNVTQIRLHLISELHKFKVSEMENEYEDCMSD